MGRPPLDIGTAGKIKDYPQPNGTHLARCKFRDYDGEVRLVSRIGPTVAAAERALKAALKERVGDQTRNADMRLAALAEAWLTTVKDSELADGSKQAYEQALNAYVLPALGRLRLREIDVPAIDRAMTALRAKHGPASTRNAKKVLGLLMAFAVRQGILTANPVRDSTPIARPRKRARSLTVAQAEAISDRGRSDEWAVAHDLPDIIDWMLATGARLGETLATRFAVNSDGQPVLDLDAGTWEVNATIVRVKGTGLVVQQRPKTEAGWRVLALPPFAVDMIRRRQDEKRIKAPHGLIFGSPFAVSIREVSNTTGDLRKFLNSIDCEECEQTGYQLGPDGKPLLDKHRKPILCDKGPFAWVTSHTFRKTVATRLEEAGLTPRQVADQLGHADPSMTLDVYFGRSVVASEAARVLDR